MRIRWLKTALRNLDDAFQYVAEDNPEAAIRLAKKIRGTIQQLKEQPAMGRTGRVPGTRELIIAGTSYLIPYRVEKNEIQLLRVFHTAQSWPRKL
jgi:toxin ParE1/3/4